MPTRNSKGQFVKKHHHRSAGGGHARSATTAIVVAPMRAPAKRKSHGGGKKHHAKKHHRRSKGGGGIKLMHVALAAGGLAYLTSDASPIKVIPEYAAKIPGAKTFGNTTMAGLACLAADRFVKRNKWLRLAGIAGVVAGALQVGSKGTDFKWLGDADDTFDDEVQAPSDY